MWFSQNWWPKTRWFFNVFFLYPSPKRHLKLSQNPSTYALALPPIWSWWVSWVALSHVLHLDNGNDNSPCAPCINSSFLNQVRYLRGRTLKNIWTTHMGDNNKVFRFFVLVISAMVKGTLANVAMNTCENERLNFKFNFNEMQMDTCSYRLP